jgi:glycosyltransferase involved in cell wall biosynthesis
VRGACLIKVALALSFQGTQQGITNYYHNLLSCYYQYPDPTLRLAVFTDSEETVAHYRSDAIEIHPCPEVSGLSARNPRNWPRRAVGELLGYDAALLKIMNRHRIDLLTHRSLGKQTSINALHWQSDFQHKEYPQFFSARVCAGRDRFIANAGIWGNILLSSNAAACDFRRFYPQLASVQTRILHFSGAAALNVVPLELDELKKQYPVSTPYFFLPNQFWHHKNHSVVVEALRRTSAEIRVICTGAMQDPRDLSYVPCLLAKVKQAGLDQRFICLGTVPYASLVSLMHHSLAVLQPSRFEGWSTSVEESKAMGKQIILSNIAVHLEQAPDRGTFFSPDSPEELGARMESIHADACAETEQKFVERRPLYKVRLEREWIEEFARILKTVSASVPRPANSFDT